MDALADKWDAVFKRPKSFQGYTSKKDPDRPYLSDNLMLGLLQSSGVLESVCIKPGMEIQLVHLNESPLLGQHVTISQLQVVSLVEIWLILDM